VDYLSWVGGRYYTIQSFIKECQTMGVSRRIPVVPELEFGKSRIFFVSDVDEGDPCVEIRVVKHKKSPGELKRFRTFRVKKKCKPTPKVFGYFVPTAIMVPGATRRAINEKYRDKIVEIPVEAVDGVQLRGCGKLVIGAIYLVDGLTLQEIYRALRTDPDLRVRELIVGGSTFRVIDPPVPAPGLKRFRGLIRVDGNAILARKPVEAWWV
jgi:hypothetical protein